MNKLVAFAKKNLVVLEGSSSSAMIYENYGKFWGASRASDLNKVIWLLPLERFQTEEVSRQLTSFIEGNPFVGGQKLRTWLSPVGLIILEREDMDRIELRDLEKTRGWMFPTNEWAYTALKSGKLLRVPSYSFLEKLGWDTSWEKEKRVREAEELRRKELEKIEELLKKNGVAVTENTVSLAKEVLSFDVYYDYSDDSSFCIRYRYYESELRQKLRALCMESVLESYIRSVLDRTKNL